MINRHFLLVHVLDNIIRIENWCITLSNSGSAILVLLLSSVQWIIILRNRNLFKLLDAHDLTSFAIL